jgi:thiamine-monophosphate kinase
MLGGPGQAVADMIAGRTPSSESRARFAHPVARLREAQWLAARGATAGIDVSDGVVADAAHLAAASGVTVALELDRLPCLPGIEPMAAAASGEEYELIVALPASAAVHDFQSVFGFPLTEIGHVTRAHGPGVVTTYHGESVAPPRGYDHFS